MSINLIELTNETLLISKRESQWTSFTAVRGENVLAAVRLPKQPRKSVHRPVCFASRMAFTIHNTYAVHFHYVNYINHFEVSIVVKVFASGFA